MKLRPWLRLYDERYNDLLFARGLVRPASGSRAGVGIWVMWWLTLLGFRRTHLQRRLV